jgi:WD40 repeat protein
MTGGEVYSSSTSKHPSKYRAFFLKVGLGMLQTSSGIRTPHEQNSSYQPPVRNCTYSPTTHCFSCMTQYISMNSLIWNLLLVGKTSIEHILHSHYRAITDINWHTTEPDTVVSTGIDSWLWSWDLRQPEKPVFGLCIWSSWIMCI